MARARTTLRTVGLLGASALVAAGCGGGGEAAAPPAGTTPTPTPSTTGDGTGVADAGATDPVTGLPVETGMASESAATATIPDLSGDDVSGGLGSNETNPIFNATAIDAETAAEMSKPKEETSASTSGTGSTDTVKAEPAKVYSGAKIYVDGIVHEISKNGSFPKGNPVFRLLSVTANDIEIELIAGEFTSGGGVGTVLDKGELVNLVNSSEQLTYRVKYLRPIEGSDGITF